MTQESSVLFHFWTLKQENDVQNDKIPNISFHSIKYSDKCLYLWIGDYNERMANLSCAIRTPFERDPVGIEIILANEELNNNTNNLGKDLSIKLAKKLNKQVFVSFNVSNDLLEHMPLQNLQMEESMNENSDFSLFQRVERCLFKEIKLNPNKF
jgi:hypothetical protein